MDLALEIKNVNQSFRSGFLMKKAQVLNDVSLTVEKNSLFGFLGANGAGKTTLIHLITGLRKPSFGNVLVFGLEAASKPAKSKIGYLPERPYFHDHLTAYGVLTYFGLLAGLTKKEIDQKSDSVLKEVGLLDAKHKELRRFSKGMLQRIGIAQALIHDPDFLILDEPMSGLDPVGRKEIRELLIKLQKQGKTIFFSSHVIPDVEAICNQVAVIDKGKMISCGPIEQFLRSNDTVIEIGFSGVEKPNSHFLEIQEIAEGYRGVCKDIDECNRAIAQLVQKKARILWVNPHRRSLEQIFDTEKKAL